MPSRTATRRPRRPVRLALQGLEDRTTPAKVYTVTTTALTTDTSKLRFDSNGNAFNTDGAAISFGEAVAAINAVVPNTTFWAFPGPSTINFNISGSGVQTIAMPDGPVTILQDQVTIDGSTQPGAQVNNANQGAPMDAVVLIELPHRINFQNDFEWLQGMSVPGVDLTGEHSPASPGPQENTLFGNFIGVRADGQTSWGDTQPGVHLGTAASPAGNNNVVRDNLISAHAGADGVLIEGATRTRVFENYIGTDATGKAGPGNGLAGVHIKGATAASTSIFGNVIAFNQDFAVRADAGQKTSLSVNNLFENGHAGGGGGVFLAPGANGGVPAPTLTSSTRSTVSGSFSGSTPYDVEVFGSPAVDPAGAAEGKTFLGSLTAVTTSSFTFDNIVSFSPGVVTAIVTDKDGNTDTFSNPITIGGTTGGQVSIKLVTATQTTVTAPGEDCTVRVTVKNDGKSQLTAPAGTALVKVWAVDGNGNKVGSVPLGQYVVPQGRTETLAAGAGKTLTVAFKFPALGSGGELPEGKYTYLAELSSAWKQVTKGSVSAFEHKYQFGTVGYGADGKTRTGVKLTVAQGQALATYSLTGPGAGAVTDNSGTVDLDLTGTTTASNVIAERGGTGGPSVRNVTAHGDLHAVGLQDVDATGALTFPGQLDGLLVNQFGKPFTAGGPPEAKLTIGTGAGRPATVLAFGKVVDASIEAKDGVRVVGIQEEWDDTAGSPRDVLSAKSVGKLIVGYDASDEPSKTGTGDFQADLTIPGPVPAGVGLEYAHIRGRVSGSNWVVGGAAAPTLKAGRVFIGGATDWTYGVAGRADIVNVGSGWTNPGLPAGTLALDVDSVGSLDIGGSLDVGGLQFHGANGNSKAAADDVHLDKVARLATLDAKFGGIKSLVADSWPAKTAVTTPWVGSLVAHKDMSASLKLTGQAPGNGLSLNSASVGDLADGTWDVFADVGQISASTAEATWTLTGGKQAGSPGTTVNQLRLTKAGTTPGSFGGTVDVTRLKQVTGAGSLTGTLKTADPKAAWSVDVDRFAATVESAGPITSLRAKAWSGGSVTAPTVKSIEVYAGGLTSASLNLTGPGQTRLTVRDMIDSFSADLPDAAGFALIQAGGWNGTQTDHFKAGYVTALTLTGAGSSTGGLNGVTLDLTGQPAADKPSLGSLTAPGMVVGLKFTDLEHGAGAIKVGQIRQSEIVTPGGIQSFTVTGLKGGSTDNFYDTRVAVQGTIGTIVLNDVSATIPPGGTYTIESHGVGSYKRLAGGVVVAQLSRLVPEPDNKVWDEFGGFQLEVLAQP